MPLARSRNVDASGEAIARRATALVGTAYRPGGRGAEGLDCVGLALAALALPSAAPARDHDRRRTSLQALEAELRRCGLRRREGARAVPGDLLVFDVGLRRLHLGITTGTAFVHADAGLGRAVERPFPAPWPLISVWSLEQPPDPEASSWPLSC